MRRGDKVRVLPERGALSKGDQRLWRVMKIEKANGVRTAHLLLPDADPPERCSVAVGDLVVVAEFRDLIYPGLAGTDKRFTPSRRLTAPRTGVQTRGLRFWSVYVSNLLHRARSAFDIWCKSPRRILTKTSS